MWNLIAKVVSRPKVADALIRRSFKTPYFNLPGYMDRWWLFNAYGNDVTKSDAVRAHEKVRWLPSIRIHHILRADDARDLHDHPWDARTIILKGWYKERRKVGIATIMKLGVVPPGAESRPVLEPITETYHRKPGDTATINFGEYHSIDEVSPGGVWTMFITYRYRGTWGFLVNGVKVPWRQYTNEGAA